MEKLIELLNEYETPRSWIVFKSYDDYDWTFYWVDCDWETEIAWSDSYICSKKFWFIEWLVENEKINEEKVKKEAEYYWTDEYDVYVWYVFYHRLLMLLSIQDKPIKDLISYLK